MILMEGALRLVEDGSGATAVLMRDDPSPREQASGPLVSVILITYQHEAFITQALDSVLAQKTDFPIEILITEDLSPDRTREMVTEFQRRHPETIRLFLSDRNQNDNEVVTRAWEAARGTYIAYLDGDDYWTDPLKLQKQVEFLERHPDVFVCGHAVSVVDEHGKERRASYFDIYEDRHYSREDLAEGWGFPVLSVLFRNNKTLPPRERFNEAPNADMFMYAFFSNFGAGYLTREVMGAYRWHPGGEWSGSEVKGAIDHRNVTLSTIPPVIHRSLRSIAYARLFLHSLREDYLLSRRLRQIPYAVVMMLVWLTPRSAKYLARQHTRRLFRT